MAHEGYTIIMLILGFILIIGYFFGPRNEVRKIKRMEGMIMLIPTGVLLIILGLIVYSGFLG